MILTIDYDIDYWLCYWLLIMLLTMILILTINYDIDYWLLTDLCILPASAEAPVLVLDEVTATDVRAGDKVLHAGQVEGEKVQAVQGEEIRPGRS